MKFQAVIFDLDGTIISTEEIWQQAAIDLIEKYEGPLSKEAKLKVEALITGASLEESARIIKELEHKGISKKLSSSLNYYPPSHNDPHFLDLKQIMEEYKNLALSKYAHGISYIPGFEKFYDKIKKLGIPTAIATNSPEDILQAVDKALNLKKYFGNHMYSISQINNVGKPNPAIYIYAAKQLGIEPKKCLAFEDSIPGINAAKAAGMYCIGMYNHHHPEFSQDANFIIKSYDQIDLKKFF